MVRLFVYGSLRPGECNYDQLSAAVTKATPASVGGWLRLRPEGYPALTLASSWPCTPGSPGFWPALPRTISAASATATVLGDVLELRWTPELGQRLDDFEGFTPESPDYLRVACWTSAGWAWTYIAPVDEPDWPTISAWPPERDLQPWVPHQRRP